VKRRCRHSRIWKQAPLLGVLLTLAGCAPAPDIGPFAEAIKWLGICIVLSSLIWATGIVLYGKSHRGKGDR